MIICLTTIVITQKTHLQPTDSTRKPAHTGPTTGPRKGPIAQIDMARPLFSGGIMPAIEPLPQVTTATPAAPARKRNAISIGTFCATAQHAENMTKRTLHTWYIGRRP